MDNLDVPIWQLTPRQFFQMQAEWMKGFQKKQEKPQPTKDWLTIEEVSLRLGRAKSTLYKYIKDWQEIGAVSKAGGVMLINIDKVISLSAEAPKKIKRSYKH